MDGMLDNLTGVLWNTFVQLMPMILTRFLPIYGTLMAIEFGIHWLEEMLETRENDIENDHEDHL